MSVKVKDTTLKHLSVLLYKAKNISDILDMTVYEALNFFENMSHQSNESCKQFTM